LDTEPAALTRTVEAQVARREPAARSLRLALAAVPVERRRWLRIRSKA
jgi:hypothetical protein